jgi:hypothetical protein
VATTFDIALPDKWATLNDHACDLEPPTFPAVMDIMREWSIPDNILHVTLERDCHSENSAAVDPRRTLIDRTRLTDETSVMTAEVCTGTLLALSVLNSGTLNDNVSVTLPASMPVVTAVRNVLSVLCGRRQRIIVSLTQCVASLLVVLTLHVLVNCT